MKKRLVVFVLLAVLSLIVSSVGLVDTYPSKPVEIIVPWSAGGATDLLYRAVAAVFPKYARNQPLLVKNIPGGGAVPGTVEFLNARPDGYTLLSMATPIITKIHMSKVTFDANSFKPVINLVDNACMLMVNVNSPYKTLPDLVEAARKNPGKISVGNGGAGGGTHLAALAFESFAGVKFLHVPFQGGGPSITALLAGQVDSIMCSAPEGFTNVTAGQFRIIAVFGGKRHPLFPEAKTGKEQGYTFNVTMWRGVAVQKDTPASTVNNLHRIMQKCLKDPEFIKKGEELGIEIKYMGPREFGKYILAEDKRYEKLIKDNKLGERYQ